MKGLFTLTLVLFLGLAFAQDPNEKLTQDPKAKVILDQVTAKTKGYQSMKATFLYTLENQQKNTKETKKGTIYIKGQKYKIFFHGLNTEVFFDGKVLATYMITDNEVTYSEPDLNAENTLTPNNIFTFYEKGFFYRRLKDEVIGSKTLNVIELVPMEREKKGFSKIKLKIDKAKQVIASVKSFGKNGVHFTIDVNDFTPNVKVTDALFTFDEKSYPDIEVIDNRN